MATAGRTLSDALAAAHKAKDIADSAAALAYANTMAPLLVTLAEAFSAAGVTRTTSIASAAVDRAKANIANGLQDSLIGLVNLTQMPGNYFWGGQGLGYLNSPDWSNGLITQEGVKADGDTASNGRLQIADTANLDWHAVLSNQ